MEFELIVERLKNDDIHALGELYDLLSKKVYNRCLFILKDQMAAEDATHDIFLKGFQRVKTLTDASKIEGWLNTMAYNHCMDILRKKQKLKVSVINEESTEIDSELLFDLEKYSEDEAIQLKLKELISELKEVDRLVLLLFYWEGKTVREISDDLGLSQSAVKMKLVRVRDSLKVNLNNSSVKHMLEILIFAMLSLI
jgi:RNA polymerase sigma-70 factor (ECF subfamily)